MNADLLYTGGHIGDGIRPSERRKGYATAMINNSGVLENEIVNEDGVMEQRYWITL